MKNYQKEAIEITESMGIEFTARLIDNDFYFDGDKETRNIYQVIFTKHGKGLPRPKLSLRFGQSIVNTEKRISPTRYDVLACITKYDPGTFADFCSEFGYDQDSRSAKKTYKAVRKEWEKVSSFFTESELEQIREIN